MNQEAIDTLLQSVKSLQKSCDYSDLKIVCGKQGFPVHKALVCPRSEFLAKACSWGRDGQAKSEIDLSDDDPKIVKLMIDYFYCLDYNDLPIDRDTADEIREPPHAKPVSEPFPECSPEAAQSISSSPDPWGFGIPSQKKKKDKKRPPKPFGFWEEDSTEGAVQNDVVFGNRYSDRSQKAVFESALRPAETRLQDLPVHSDADRFTINAQLYALADKYGMESLKRLAQVKFTQAAEQSWRSQGFVKAAQLVFDGTPSTDLGLRSVVINTLNMHRELMDYEEVQGLLDSGNGAAWQLVKALLNKSSSSSSPFNQFGNNPQFRRF